MSKRIKLESLTGSERAAIITNADTSGEAEDMYSSKRLHELLIEAQQQEAKIERLAFEKKQVEAEVTELKFRLALTSGANSTRYIEIEKIVPLFSESGFCLPPTDELPIETLWKSFQHELPNDAEIDSFTKEDEQLHPIMETIITKIMKVEDIPLQYGVRKFFSVPLPLLRPDGALYSREFEKPCWADVFVLFEYQLLVKTQNHYDGFGQMTGYLDCALQNIPDTEFRDRIGIYSDFRNISILFADNGKYANLTRSGLLPLFPSGWVNLPQPTLGFIMLCRSLGLRTSPPTAPIVIQNISYPVQGTISSKDGLLIVIVKYNDEDAFVKTCLNQMDKRSRLIIAEEAAKLKYLASSETLKSYVIEIFPEVHSNTTIVTKVGKPLDLLVEEGNVYGLELIVGETNFDTLRKHYIHLLEGLREFHKESWSHGDIRPSNIVIYNGTSRFVDVFTAHTGEWLYGVKYQEVYDPFWPEEKRTGGDRFKKDLYSLAYTILFLHVNEEQRQSFKLAALREVLMDNQTTGFGLIAKSIAENVKLLGSEYVNVEFYNLLISKLST